jgi:bifunctional non-homologous end joining protein LigD
MDWEFVVETAFRLRDLLLQEGLDSWPKTTGGKGLHIMVPIEAEMACNTAHDYTREIAERLAATAPGKYTTSAAFSARPGKLFIDYLLNGRGTTAIGAYSPRARDASPPIPGLGRASGAAPLVGFFHGTFQPHLDQMQHAPINDPTRHRL